MLTVMATRIKDHKYDFIKNLLFRMNLGTHNSNVVMRWYNMQDHFEPQNIVVRFLQKPL